MAYFKFISYRAWNAKKKHKCDAKHVPLVTVDKKICGAVGETCDKKHYNPFYQTLVEMAFNSLMKLGGGHIEMRHIEDMEASIDYRLKKGKQKDHMLMALRGLIRWAFAEQWVFVGWR